MKIRKIAFVIALLLLTLVVFTRGPTVAEANSPYSVPNHIQTSWDANYGSKSHLMASGRNIVYDVYANKYNPTGYRIVNKNFGSGSQPYVEFYGWSVIFGHRHHTSTNHSTYIVAEDRSNINNVKIYRALPHGNLSASEDLEYNKSQSTPTTLWNRCGDSVRNTINTTCNMEYVNVGFVANLPLNELFPDPAQAKEWRLYIVKDVDGHVVYTPLILPFNFDNHTFEGGEVSLSSGVNANQLSMNAYPVVRRTQPRSSESGTTRGYFTQGNTYTRVTQNESDTAVWYGVRSPHDSNATRWAASAYWTFGGSQAIIGFAPDDRPPIHISHSMTSTYQNGNNYWVQPDTPVTINLRQRDLDSGNKYQYIRLEGSGQQVRKRHSFLDSSITDISDVSVFNNTPSLAITGARRTENTTYGRVDWSVVPRTHGHSYDVLYHYTDQANNAFGYDTGAGLTGMKLRVDGVAPTHISQSITGARYEDGGNYWIQSSDQLFVNARQRDVDSGNKYQYLRALTSSGAHVSRSRHDFFDVATTNHQQLTDSNFVISSSNRTENTTYGNVRWTVDPKGHGQSYDVQKYYDDNVGNNTGYSTIGTVKVDDVAPTHVSQSITGARYVNGNNYWIQSNDQLLVNVRQRDVDSGNKYQYLRALTSSGAIVARSRHDFFDVANTNHQQLTDSNFVISSANRTENTTYGNLQWTVEPKGHGQSYDLQRYYQDNVDNNTDYSTFATIKVDDVAPTVAFRNSEDTADFFTNSDRNSGNVSVRIKSTDADSGFKRSQYGWSTSATAAPASWSAWSTSSDSLVTQNDAGSWYLHVRSEDNAGNVTSVQRGPYHAFMNQPPVASITFSPTTVYNNTSVTLRSNASDPDGDPLTYQWSYQEPGISTWTNFSTEENPVRIFDEKGNWPVRLVVSDGIESVTVSTVVPVINRPPVADFNWNPEEIYMNTAVTMINASSDPDGDTLTYQWAYQAPGSTNWVNFSTLENPIQIYATKGNWNIRLTVSDGAATAIVTKILPVLNTPPTVTLEYAPELIYEGDTVTLTARPSDLDGDTMTLIFEERVNGTWQEFNRAENVSTGDTITYSYIANPKTYEIRVRAIDESNDEAIANIQFIALPLEIKGVVKHTPDWQAIHDESGHEPNQFYAGERFLTEAIVTDHPIKKVTVSFTGEQITGNLLNLLLPMVERTHPVYEVEIYDRVAGDPTEHLAPGMVYFIFEAEWENGVIKQDKVGVNIVSDIYGAFDFYRSN